MQHLWTLALAFVFAWSGEALASLPAQPGQPSMSADDGSTHVARRKKRRKKKKKKRKKKKRGGGAAAAPAPAPEPPPEPPPADTAGDSGTATEGDSKEATDWGSSDWASPDWAGGGGGGSSSSSSDLLKEDTSEGGGGGGGGGGDDEPAEKVEKEVKPSKRYKKNKGVGGAFVLLSPVYEGVNRKFSFSPRDDNLRPYEASFVSMVGARLEFYPGVLLEIPYLDAVGIRGGYSMALGLKSAARTDPNTEFSTNFSELDVDLAGRFVLGDAILTVGAGFGMLTFGIDAGGAIGDQVQDLGYTFIRAGLDFRYSVGQLSILAGGAYRHVLGSGELSDTVNGASAMGFDANAGVAFQLLDFAEVFALFQFTQFMHSFSPQDPYVAKSATDRYLGGQAGVTLFF